MMQCRLRRRALWQWALIVAGICFAGAASALQFDHATVHSGLNQPLDASLTISHLSAREKKSLTIRKAPKKYYKHFNFKRDLMVGRIKVKTSSPSGGDKMRVSLLTRQPIQRSVVSFVLEAETSDGRYLHRYDLLINPGASRAVADGRDRVSNKPVGQGNRAQSLAPAGSAEQQINSIVGGSTEQGAQSKRRHGDRVNVQPDNDYPSANEPRKHKNYGPVKKGETLWHIASKIKPTGASTAQMALALFKSTPRAFDHGKVTSLKTGAYLTVPYDKNVFAVDKDEARRQLKQAQ